MRVAFIRSSESVGALVLEYQRHGPEQDRDVEAKRPIAQILEIELHALLHAGEVVAAASTVAAAPTVVAESIGPRVVKGREEPVEVFRILGSSA